MVAVKYDDLSVAFDFVSYGAPMEHHAYVSLETGQVYWASDFSDAFNENLPEDLETSNHYLAIPHKNELDLGRSLALRFAIEQLPTRYNQVEGFFRRQGAYARFKDLLEREGVLERWYAFEVDSVEKALRQWCADNGLDILD
ncbi:hypothetical protein [Burkholderia cenocepacia]|uniref:hypothetical protein n=1 Tax=Burkholderia cenocepacia TaxID=95486 RepID=UPI000F5B4142|nr:hypothetical protein [Burkholderia cenocepacia]RQU49423.1 hypothetical protein DF143_37130 [Burkholderia cenocepacia]RQV32389.1 hypothetical protein DF033_36220 [Burkholderia cenocepacia]